MSEITKNYLVGGYNGCIRINAIGKVVQTKTGTTLTLGDYALYSLKIGVIDKGSSIDLGMINSKKRATQDNYKCGGTRAGRTRGEVETNDRSLSFTFADDYNYAINNIEPEIQKNIAVAMLEGQSFILGSAHADGTKDVIAVVSMAGNEWLGTTNAVVDQDYANFKLLDGKLILANKKNSDGTLAVETNDIVTTYFDTMMVSVEGMWEYAGSIKKGFTAAYNFCTENTFNEGSSADINKHAVTFDRYCDCRSKSKYTVDGITDAQLINGSPGASVDVARIGIESNAVSTGNVYFGSVGTTLGVIATVTLSGATIGDIIVLVGDGTNVSDNNEVYIFKVTGATAASLIDTNYNLVIGTNIFITKEIISALTTDAPGEVALGDISTAPVAVANYGYVVTKTAGATGVADAVTFGSEQILWIYDWSFTNTTFESFSGE